MKRNAYLFFCEGLLIKSKQCNKRRNRCSPSCSRDFFPIRAVEFSWVCFFPVFPWPVVYRLYASLARLWYNIAHTMPRQSNSPTSRGRQILELWIQGVTREGAVAKQLGISQHTIHGHVEGDRETGLLGLKGLCERTTGIRPSYRTEILRTAIQEGWISL